MYVQPQDFCIVFGIKKIFLYHFKFLPKVRVNSGMLTTESLPTSPIFSVIWVGHICFPT